MARRHGLVPRRKPLVNVNATITVNGKPLPCTDQSVRELLVSLGIPPDREGLAVAVNAAVVPREAWEERRLFPGDKVEIVHPLAGGGR